MKTYIQAAMLALAGAVAAQEFVSEEYYEGVYWDPDTPGEGFTFDTQNGLGFMTIYSYDGDGEPTFFTAIGAIDTGAKGSEMPVFEAQVFRTRNFTDSEAVGELQMFDREEDLRRLTMRWDEREIDLERFVYAYAPDPLGRLPGTWLFVTVTEVPEGAGIVDLVAVEGTVMSDSRGPYLQAQSFTVSGDPTRIYFEDDEFVAVTPLSDEPGTTSVIRFQASENVISGIEYDGDADGMPVSEEGAAMLGYRLSYLDLLSEPDR